MPKQIYLGVDGVARKVAKIYGEDKGVAREIMDGYIGVDGVARKTYEAFQEIDPNGDMWVFKDDVREFDWCKYIDDHGEYREGESQGGYVIEFNVNFTCPLGVTVFNPETEEFSTAYAFNKICFCNYDESNLSVEYTSGSLVAIAAIGELTPIDGYESPYAVFTDGANTISFGERYPNELRDLLNIFAVKVDEPPQPLIGTTWLFKPNIDPSEWSDFIWENCNDQDWPYLGFDISFTCPDGVSRQPCGIAYDFQRMEFHDNDDEGGAIIYYFADHEIEKGFYDPDMGRDEIVFVGDAYVVDYNDDYAWGIFDKGFYVTLNEEPTQLLRKLLSTFATKVSGFDRSAYAGSSWRIRDFYGRTDYDSYYTTRKLDEFIRKYSDGYITYTMDAKFIDKYDGKEYVQIKFTRNSNTEFIKFYDSSGQGTVAMTFDANCWNLHGFVDYLDIQVEGTPSEPFFEFLKSFGSCTNMLSGGTGEGCGTYQFKAFVDEDGEFTEACEWMLDSSMIYYGKFTSDYDSDESTYTSLQFCWNDDEGTSVYAWEEGDDLSNWDPGPWCVGDWMDILPLDNIVVLEEPTGEFAEMLKNCCIKID